MNRAPLRLRNAILCSALLAAAQAATAGPIQWETDLQVARQKAWNQKRLLLLHFWSPDCAPCLQLEQVVFSQAAVADALNATVVPVKIDASKDPQLAALMGVRSWPTDVLVTPDGQIIGSWQSPQQPQRYVQQVLERSHSAAAQLAQAAQLRAEQAAQQARQVVDQGRQIANQWNQQTQQWAQAAQQVINQVDHSAQQWADPLRESSPPSQAAMTNPHVQGPAVTPASTDPHDAAAAQWQANPHVGQGSSGVGGATAAAPWQAAAGPPASSPPASSLATGPATTGNSAPPSAAVAAGQTYGPPATPNPQSPTAPPWANPPANWMPNSSDPTASGPVAGAPNYGQPSGTTGPAPSPHNNLGAAPTQPPQTPSAAAPAGPRGDVPAWGHTAGQPGQSRGTDEMPRTEFHPPIGLEGYCPVTLLEDERWVMGDPRFGAIHRGRTYLFMSEAHQRKFIQDPDRYSPVLAGVDPVVLVDSGKVVEGKRAHGVVFDQHVYLFSSEETLRRFWDSPESYSQPIRQAMRTGSIQQMLR